MQPAAAPSPETFSARARLNALQRHRNPADPAIAEARTELAAQRLADHIRRTLDTAPPLTPEQRDRLALLLRPTAGESAA